MLDKLKYMLNVKWKRSMGKNDINMDELKKLVSNGATLIDVRSPQEYEEGHLKGAISIPEYELKSRYKNELKDKDANIIIYCSSGSRSKKAKKLLEKMGYNNVYNLYNGIQNWDSFFYKSSRTM